MRPDPHHPYLGFSNNDRSPLTREFPWLGTGIKVLPRPSGNTRPSVARAKPSPVVCAPQEPMCQRRKNRVDSVVTTSVSFHRSEEQGRVWAPVVPTSPSVSVVSSFSRTVDGVTQDVRLLVVQRWRHKPVLTPPT